MQDGWSGISELVLKESLHRALVYGCSSRGTCVGFRIFWGEARDGGFQKNLDEGMTAKFALVLAALLAARPVSRVGQDLGCAAPSPEADPGQAALQAVVDALAQSFAKCSCPVGGGGGGGGISGLSQPPSRWRGPKRRAWGRRFPRRRRAAAKPWSVPLPSGCCFAS